MTGLGDGAASTVRISQRLFHQNELEKSKAVQINAMKNQWLMLLKNEDVSNLVRDFPFILAREAMIATHHLFFAPRALIAIPMTLKLIPETLRKRRAAKRKQKMDPKALRRWLVGGAENRPRQGATPRGFAGDSASPLAREDRSPGLD
jgi:hypothetical protein